MRSRARGYTGGTPSARRLAAETGGSVDIDDMARRPSSPVSRRPRGGGGHRRHQPGRSPSTTSWCLTAPPSRHWPSSRSYTVARAGGTVGSTSSSRPRQASALQRRQLDNLAVTTASTAVTNGQVGLLVIQPAAHRARPAGGRTTSSPAAPASCRPTATSRQQRSAGQPAEEGCLADFIPVNYKAVAVLAKGQRRCSDLRRDGVPYWPSPSRQPTRRRSKGIPICAVHIVSYQQERGQHVPEAGPHLVTPQRQGCLRPPVQQGGLECSGTPVLRRHPR